MKAFIVLALVSCVAARHLDIDTLRLLSKEKSLLSRDDILLKDRLLTNTHRFSPKKHNLLSSFDSYTPETTYGYGYDDVDVTEPTTSWRHRQVTVLDLEEIVSYPLFREYMQIPLFRQFWEQYPTVFRRYVESPLFQQFWTVPAFMQYFRNPIFFYKYIVPQVQIIAQSLPYSTEGIFHHKYPSTQGYNYDVQDYVSRPSYERRHVTVEEYLNKIFGHGIERSAVSYPYGYSSDYSDRYTTPYFGGRSTHYGQGLERINHKFLLDKIYKTLFLNKPTVGEVTQVRTDVKIEPAHKEVVVEPVTGESHVVYEPKQIVDVKVEEKVVPRSAVTYDHVERNVVVKEALLKRLLINKHISVELYTILKTLPLHHVKEIVRRIVSPSVWVQYESIFGDEFTYPTRHHDWNTEDVKEFTFPTRHHNYNNWGVEDVNNVDINDVLYRHKINEIVGQLYNKEFVGDRYTPVVRDLMKVLGHHNTVRDVLPIEEIVRA